jgi:hypothetical protein
MIIVRLLGGLGNQMFQYALGKTLSVLNSTSLKLDTTILEDHRPGVHAVNRNYDLDIFSLSVPKASRNELWKFHSHGLPIAYKVANKALRFLNTQPIVNEKHFHFDAEILRAPDGSYLNGLWQSYKYFAPAESQIRKDFTFRFPLSEMESRMADNIRSRKSVCINVRRTDYISQKATSDVMTFTGLEYYHKAIAHLTEKINNPSFFIFSDEIEWCKENFTFLKDATFVGHEYAGPKFSSYLQLMSCCDYFIIPNSTFAWWGAWMNMSPSKIVITPKRWMNDPNINTTDLLPAGWMSL